MSDPVASRPLADAVRDACIRAAREGYTEALTSGLCREGAWELALDRMRSVDLGEIERRLTKATASD